VPAELLSNWRLLQDGNLVWWQVQPSKGVEFMFAEHIGVSRITFSHMKSSRNISDKMASQIETKTSHEARWLDQPRESVMPSPGLQAFLALAGSAWQSGNAAERRRLMQMAKGGFKLTRLAQ
jgi:hypothetical protein